MTAGSAIRRPGWTASLGAVHRRARDVPPARRCPRRSRPCPGPRRILGRRRVRGRDLDDLQDRGTEAPKALTERALALPGGADPPNRHPGGFERLLGPVEVGRGDDDVIEADRTVRVRQALAAAAVAAVSGARLDDGCRRPRSRRRSDPAQRPGADAVAVRPEMTRTRPSSRTPPGASNPNAVHDDGSSEIVSSTSSGRAGTPRGRSYPRCATNGRASRRRAPHCGVPDVAGRARARARRRCGGRSARRPGRGPCGDGRPLQRSRRRRQAKAAAARIAAGPTAARPGDRRSRATWMRSRRSPPPTACRRTPTRRRRPGGPRSRRRRSAPRKPRPT